MNGLSGGIVLRLERKEFNVLFDSFEILHSLLAMKSLSIWKINHEKRGHILLPEHYKAMLSSWDKIHQAWVIDQNERKYSPDLYFLERLDLMWDVLSKYKLGKIDDSPWLSISESGYVWTKEEDKTCSIAVHHDVLSIFLLALLSFDAMTNGLFSHVLWLVSISDFGKYNNLNFQEYFCFIDAEINNIETNKSEIDYVGLIRRFDDEQKQMISIEKMVKEFGEWRKGFGHSRFKLSSTV